MTYLEYVQTIMIPQQDEARKAIIKLETQINSIIKKISFKVKK